MMDKEFCGITFSKCGPKIQSAVLGDFASKVKTRIPEDYIEFLRVTNGGHPCPSGFRVANESQEHQKELEELREELEGVDEFDDEDERRQLQEEIEFHENVCVPRRVAGFFSLATGRYDSLEAVFRNSQDARLFSPYKMLPIGLDSDGIGLCISLEDDSFGSVILVPPPTAPGEPRELSELQAGFIASSFSQFLKSLFSARLEIKDGYNVPARFLKALGVEENFSE